MWYHQMEKKLSGNLLNNGFKLYLTSKALSTKVTTRILSLIPIKKSHDICTIMWFLFFRNFNPADLDNANDYRNSWRKKIEILPNKHPR